MKKIQLESGIKMGSAIYRTVQLRPLTVGDHLAVEEVGGGMYRQAVETLSRQIAWLESDNGARLEGPLALAIMKQLTSRDMATLAAASEEVEAGGRDDADSGGGTEVRVSDSPAHRVVLS